MSRRSRFTFSHSPHYDRHPLIGFLSLEYLLLPHLLTVTVENHQMPFVGATAIHVFPRLLETFFNGATLQPVDDLQFQHHPPQEEGIADEVAATATLRQAHRHACHEYSQWSTRGGRAGSGRAAGLNDESAQPLQAVAGHPVGGVLESTSRFALYFALQQAVQESQKTLNVGLVDLFQEWAYCYSS